jgi:hypothetical protein
LRIWFEPEDQGGFPLQLAAKPVLLGLALVAACVASSAALADEPLLGRPVAGVTVTSGADGKITFRPGDLVVLEDGRELRRFQGDQFRLLSKGDASAVPPDISGLDFLLQASELVGHRVRATGGALVGANVEFAQLALQGGTVIVRFAGAATDAVRKIVVDCAGFTRNEAKCGYNVSARSKWASWESQTLLIPCLSHGLRNDTGLLVRAQGTGRLPGAARRGRETVNLSVMHVGGEWQWLVRRDGCDVAEGTARLAEDAQRGRPKP